MTEVVVRSSAPIRVCDLGGWTDTWFAAHGRVVNFGVAPRVHVVVRSSPSDGDPAVAVDLRNYGIRFTPSRSPANWGRHALIEATLHRMGGSPPAHDVEVVIWSDAPPGASTGTSASLCVALIGALDALGEQGSRLSPEELVAAAHGVETELLGLQSGVQDQVCAVHGGVNDVLISPYPHAQRTEIQLEQEVREALDGRLSLIYLGPHRSSALHQLVIATLEHHDEEPAALGDLREAARSGALALRAGDLAGFGAAMIHNTMAQRDLHPGLVGARARRVFDLAEQSAALGWKVNGAGGEGGSLSVLHRDDASRAEFERVIESRRGPFRPIPVRLADGLVVTITLP